VRTHLERVLPRAHWLLLVLIAPVADDAPVIEPLRARLLKLVTQKPGLPVGAILAETQMGWGTLYYHLSKLAKENQIQIVRVGRRRLVYPASGGRATDFAAGDALLRGRTARQIAEAIANRPGSSIQTIVDSVGYSPRAVYYHVRRLIEAGLVTSSSETRHRDLCPTPRLRAILKFGGVDEDAGEPRL
jgi:predicted transcriptional regulator